MNKPYIISVILVTLFSCSALAQPQVGIAKYLDNRKAAVSYTFDDGYLEHFTLVFPEFEKRNIKGTFAINGVKHEPGYVAKLPVLTWEQLSVMARAGHEISNHGWKHLNLKKRPSDEAMRFDVQHNDTIIHERTGFFPRTFIYPFNAKNDSVIQFCSQDRVGTRLFQVSVGSKRSEEWLNNWVDSLIIKGDWGVGMTHGITHGYDCFGDASRFWRHLDYAVSLNELWVATLHDVLAYTALRNDIKLRVKKTKDGYCVTPETTLDKEIYRSELTMTITDKREMTASQDGKQLKVTYTTDGAILNFDPFGSAVEVRIKE